MGINNHCIPFAGKLVGPRTRMRWASDAKNGRSTPRHENVVKPQVLPACETNAVHSSISFVNDGRLVVYCALINWSRDAMYQNNQDGERLKGHT